MTFTVQNTLGNVTDVNSLPWAIDQANATPDVDTIVFVAGLGPLITIVDLMVIEEGLTITGPGESALTIDAPGTVFEVTPNTAGIDVTISGLTLKDSTFAGGCGINSIDADLTIFDITANDFLCDGVSVADGSFTATDVTVNGNGDGISFTGSAPAHTLVLSGIVANDNFISGITAAVTDSTASVTAVHADRSANGVAVFVDGGTATISDVHANDSVDVGIAVITIDNATVNFTNSSAGVADPLVPSTGVGMVLQLTQSSALVASHLTVSHHELGGILASLIDNASLDLQASLVENNGILGPCGCSGGGGIYFTNIIESAVSISGTHVLGNSGQDGAGIFVGGYEGSDSSLTITDSVISGNEAVGGGGGLYVPALGVNGLSAGPLTIVRTTISGNTAQAGAGFAIDEITHTLTGDPILLIDSSTISGNTATTAGGAGGYVQKTTDSGGLGVVRLVNSTFSGNTAALFSSGFDTDGGLGLSADEMATEIMHSTIASNVGATGVLLTGNQRVLITHTISADNDVDDLDLDIADPLDFLVLFSLIETPEASVVIPPSFPGNIVGVDPALGPLKNNGGPTFTHLIAPGSAAYNAGNPAISGAPAFDQRGFARIYQTVDIGAVEWHPALAATGSKPEPEPGLAGLLLLFTGLALVAASRRFSV